MTGASDGPARGPFTLRGLLWGLLFVALAVAVITLRVVAAGELEIAASTHALLAGAPREATLHARAAATWYAPGAPHVRVAYERLLALGDAAEKRQNRDIALLAFRSVRTASESTRWLVTPHAADVARANEAVARIDATLPRPPKTSLEPAPVIERAELETLARDASPRREWIVALVVAFAASALGLGSVLFRAIDESGKITWARARLGVVMGACGLGLWAAALYFA